MTRPSSVASIGGVAGTTNTAAAAFSDDRAASSVGVKSAVGRASHDGEMAASMIVVLLDGVAVVVVVFSGSITDFSPLPPSDRTAF